MIESREDAPLLAKALHQGRARKAAAGELDRDLLLEGGIGAFRQVDDSHAAVSQLLEDPVGPDAPAGGDGPGALFRHQGDRGRGAGAREAWGFQEIAGFLVRGQEGFHLTAQRLVPRAGLRHKGRALRFRTLQRIGGDPFHSQPAFGGQGGGLIRRTLRRTAPDRATPWPPPTRA